MINLKCKAGARLTYPLVLAVMLLSLIAAGCTADSAPRPLKFLALSDTHIATGADVERLRDFLYTVRNRDVEFVVVLGDLVGHQPEYLPAVKRVAEGSQLPVYLLPGNHDDNYAHNAQWWTSVFQSPYYRFSHGGYNFIMNWSQDRDAPLPWLKAALDSIPSGEPIVFCQHFPPASSGAPHEGPWPLLTERREDLVVAFSGHTHSRRSDSVGTIRSETLGACSMSASRAGNFYEITLNGKQLEKIESFSFAELAHETPPNAPPTVAVINDSAYFVLDKPIVVHGAAADDSAVEEVQWRIGSEPWRTAEGAGQWSVALAPGSLDPGHHLLRLRGLDDEGLYSMEFATATLYVPEHWQDNTVVLSQGRGGYAGCEDITVKRHDPRANGEGEDLDCWVYGPDGSQEFSETYIRFELGNIRPSQRARVSSVRLELFSCRQNKLSYQEGSNLYRVGVAGGQWNEGITFSSRPDQPGWHPSSGSTLSTVTFEWPVPADVQEIRPEVKVTVELDGFIEQVERWIDNPRENLGWVISPVRENYNISFRSSEFGIGSLRPRLVIEFE